MVPTLDNLRLLLNNNRKRRVATLEWDIENLVKDQEKYFKSEIDKIHSENDKLVEKLRTENRVHNDTIRNLKEIKLVLESKNEELHYQIKDLKNLLDRFLPAEKSVERYCNNCNSSQKFITNN